MVLSVDAKRVDGTYHVFLNGGRVDTGLDALEWIRQGVDRGAGEVVVNSIDTDGVKKGFDLEMLRDVSEIVHVPVIASGGAGACRTLWTCSGRSPTCPPVWRPASSTSERWPSPI